MNNTLINSTVEGIITKGVGGLYHVATSQGVFQCNARGVFRERKITPLIGDRVTVQRDDVAMTGTIQTIHERKNELTRPKVANVDQALIMLAAAQPAFNRDLLDRYLLLAGHGHIPAVICINKMDLAPPGLFETIAAVYGAIGYTLLLVSTQSGEGLDALRNALCHKMTVLAGPSGVGKSSLINRLTPTASRETGRLSVRINRGRHTTRHTEILPIDQCSDKAGYIIDTPGFTSLDLSSIPVGAFASLFVEFSPYIPQCRFSDCMHDKETDCAVKAQVGLSIDPQRYASYLSLLR